MRTAVLSLAITLLAAAPALPLHAQATDRSAAMAETSEAVSWVPDASALRDIETYFEQSKVPGMQIAVIENGEVAWHANYGRASLDRPERVEDDTTFEVASLSKPVFAYLVLQMVDQGRLDLDDRLADFVLPADFPEHEWIREITVRHVLTHQTGLPNWREWEPRAGEKMIPEFRPGTGESYSGEAFMWLQEVVEHVTNRSTSQLLDAYLFHPAGIDAWLGWRPEIAARSAGGHRIDENTDEMVPVRRFEDNYGQAVRDLATRWRLPLDEWRMHDWRNALRVSYPVGPSYEDYERDVIDQPTNVGAGTPGSMRFSARDYAKFMTVLMDRQHNEDWKLSEPMLGTMLSPHTKRWHEDLPGGLGIGIELDETGRYFYHGGNNGRAFISFMIGHPASGRGIVVLTNGEGGFDLYKKVLDRLIDADLRSIT